MTVVTVIPGDGIGPEVVAATMRVLGATGVDFSWDVRPAGAAGMLEGHEPLPKETIASIEETGLALKGPLETPLGAGVRSLNAEMRIRLDLYASLRPCVGLNPRAGRPGCDFLLIRENHEDVFAGIEFASDAAETVELRGLVERTHGRTIAADAGISLRPISAAASERVMRIALDRAVTEGRRKVTVGHKANVMLATDLLFLEVAREVAIEYGSIVYEEELIDTLCGRLVADPSRYDVIVLPNLFGDIVSDIGAALVGGTGAAGGVNVGPRCAVFEAVHGSARRLAGRGIANPTGLMQAGVLLLHRIGEDAAAEALLAALREVLSDPASVTYDQAPGPHEPLGTEEFAERVEGRVRELLSPETTDATDR
jgi:isocitrate dehydrogenase (NAD+)